MRVTVAVAMLMLSGCGAQFGSQAPGSSLVACSSDRECGPGQVCFAEGCADPGRGIVVEVTGNGLLGQLPKDFVVEDGTLGPERNFDLGEPVTLGGELARRMPGVPTEEVGAVRAYADTVRLTAWGTSELIPGLTRSYEARVAPAHGRYELVVGSGRYEVTATPSDQSIPPLVVRDVVVGTSGSAEVNFTFPSEEGAVVLEGRLLDLVDESADPASEVPLTHTAADVQAFDPISRKPLSQRFEVSSGNAGALGDFRMTLSPAVRELPVVMLRASPRLAGAALPFKDFILFTPLPRAVRLSFGGPGPLLEVSGTVADRNGNPVAGAQVLLEGEVTGGGVFRSQVVLTQADGMFLARVLRPSSTYRVTVVPPAGHPAAVTTRDVGVSPTGALVPPVVQCERRLAVRGVVLGLDGDPAPGVLVEAEEHAVDESAVNGRVLPLDTTRTRTDADGEFELAVDPGAWRLEFHAGALPVVSRLVRLEEGPDRDRELDSPVRLSPGRVVTGVVFAGPPGQRTVVPRASLRFFRALGGAVTPLGATVADLDGRYTIVLPASP